MKTLPSVILVLLFLSTVTVDSSTNITRNSCIVTPTSPDGHESINSPYWLSPSGNFAFGFYPLPSSNLGRFLVGIWFIKSKNTTLVWTATPTGKPLRYGSSVLFNNDGYFTLQSEDDGKVKPLLPHGKLQQKPASYAHMHDNGNFVLYDSDSNIVWQSFDYPTSTILGGQELKNDYNLGSGTLGMDRNRKPFMLGFGKLYRSLLICYRDRDDDDDNVVHYSRLCEINIIWHLNYNRRWTRPRYGNISMNLDPINGRLYFIDNRDNMVLKNITKGENRTQQQEQYDQAPRNVLYRATLETDGYFRLYKETFGNFENSNTTLLWDSGMVKSKNLIASMIELAGLCYLLGLIFAVLAGCSEIRDKRKRKGSVTSSKLLDP